MTGDLFGVAARGLRLDEQAQLEALVGSVM